MDGGEVIAEAAVLQGEDRLGVWALECLRGLHRRFIEDGQHFLGNESIRVQRGR